MHIAYITFRLFFSLFFLWFPEAYGHKGNLAPMAEQLGTYLYAYNVHTEDGNKEKKYVYGLRATYEEAMQVYNPSASGGVDSEKSKASLHHLKDRMGKQQRWCALLVSGYVRLYVNAAIQAVDLPEVFIPKDIHCVIGSFVELESDCCVIATCVFAWALYDKQWAFITEWLGEGMSNPALCRDTDFLKKYATNIYTYDNNFLQTRLLRWLIHEKKWPAPTDRQITYIDINQGYKMRAIQLLHHESTLLYDLQCVHILNKAIAFDLDNKKEKMRTMRAKVIEKHSYVFELLSCCSMVYWRYIHHWCWIKVWHDVAYDLVKVTLWGGASLIGAMVIKYSVGFGRLVTLLVAYLLFSIGPTIYLSLLIDPGLILLYLLLSLLQGKVSLDWFLYDLFVGLPAIL